MSKPVSPQSVSKAYSYIRFSTPAQAKGGSLQRQMEKAEQYALAHGHTLDTELNLKDLGVSGYSGANVRTGALGAFLDAVKSGEVPRGSFLLIENMDRLTRDDILPASTLFNQILMAGINLVTLTSGEVWSEQKVNANPQGMIIATIELIRGNQESARKSELVRAAKTRLKARLLAGELGAKPYTRQTPAWIKWDDAKCRYVLIPDRARQVRDIFKLADKGHGIHRIASDLTARGVATWSGAHRKATHWDRSYVRRILASPAAIGFFAPKTTTRSPRGTRVDEATDKPVKLFPAAVPDELYWRVSRRFAATSARGRNAVRPAQSIVAGLIKCGACGASVVRTAKGGYAYLVCSLANAKASGCKYRAVRYEAVEAELVDCIKGIVKDAPRGKTAAGVERQIATLQFACERLEDQGTELTREFAETRNRLVKGRIRAMDAELTEKRAALHKLTVERETRTTTSVRARMQEVQQALLCKPLDVVAANQALKSALRQITMDLVGGSLDLYWHHAEKPQQIPFVTRHVPSVNWNAPPPWEQP